MPLIPASLPLATPKTHSTSWPHSQGLVFIPEPKARDLVLSAEQMNSVLLLWCVDVYVWMCVWVLCCVCVCVLCSVCVCVLWCAVLCVVLHCAVPCVYLCVCGHKWRPLPQNLFQHAPVCLSYSKDPLTYTFRKTDWQTTERWTHLCQLNQVTTEQQPSNSTLSIAGFYQLPALWCFGIISRWSA